jgi:hypothetical protein
MMEEELPADVADFADLNTEREVPTSCVLSSLGVVVQLRYLRNLWTIIRRDETLLDRRRTWRSLRREAASR